VIAIVGLSHRTSDLPLREAMAFAQDGLAAALARLRAEARLSGAMILSTCNRVELYGQAEDADRLEERLADFLCAFHGRQRAELDAFVYRLAGAEAVRHAFRVAASLDSMVLGEPQILGQVKEAYRIAEEAGALGSGLIALRNRSLAAAKRARNETGIGQNAVSVSYVAVELARKIFGSLRDRNVLLVGTGKMSGLAARHLVSGGARATVLGMRTMDHAVELAATLGGRAAPLSALREELSSADIVISSTGAPGLVIHLQDVESARAHRRGRQQRPLFLIDIAVPRDVEPSVGKLDGVFLYDLDDLRTVSEANMRERRKEAAAAEALVEREAREFLEWQKSLDVVPLLKELRRRAEDIRRTEVDKVRRRLGPLTPEQEQALEAATEAIVQKLLHAPTVQLKEMVKNGHPPEQIGLFRKLLGL
jgi:glutamyl-tRNA reductase